MAREQRHLLPAFFQVLINGQQAFLSAQQVATDPGLRAEIATCAMAELQAWLDRYADFFLCTDSKDGKRMIAAINREKERMGGRWPTWSARFPGAADEQDAG